MHIPPQRVGDRARNGTKAVRTERPHVSVAMVMATRPVKTEDCSTTQPTRMTPCLRLSDRLPIIQRPTYNTIQWLTSVLKRPNHEPDLGSL